MKEPQEDYKIYDIVKMKQHIDSLDPSIYKSSVEYLTGTKDDQRYLKMETLKLFKVGLGQEKFFDEEKNEWINIDVVYFPMFMPVE